MYQIIFTFEMRKFIIRFCGKEMEELCNLAYQCRGHCVCSFIFHKYKLFLIIIISNREKRKKRKTKTHGGLYTAPHIPVDSDSVTLGQNWWSPPESAAVKLTTNSGRVRQSPAFLT
jgi:hypothetical protein